MDLFRIVQRLEKDGNPELYSIETLSFEASNGHYESEPMQIASSDESDYSTITPWNDATTISNLPMEMLFHILNLVVEDSDYCNARLSGKVLYQASTGSILPRRAKYALRRFGPLESWAYLSIAEDLPAIEWIEAHLPGVLSSNIKLIQEGIKAASALGRIRMLKWFCEKGFKPTVKAFIMAAIHNQIEGEMNCMLINDIAHYHKQLTIIYT